MTNGQCTDLAEEGNSSTPIQEDYRFDRTLGVVLRDLAKVCHVTGLKTLREKNAISVKQAVRDDSTADLN
ncbi:hypothetical protein FHS55_002194 [Angulomicrobium tetraedrale]|uniref:Uncharacterized protein n=1 Tax=Ancylobacter tetraedralis TaxID=217068 RepID=A0A839ZA44_9HYPH|nr:hypothetical protein [Ancylobacter tetraedralis]MBB3771595.1 hypothetical protein [Ancylobacter tetraedralis]